MSNLDSAGERLKRIRQEKGISLDEVQKKTKIQMNILKAIEGESLTNLNPIYLKGFLKIYCKFLGVEPKDYIPDYKEYSSRPLSIPEVDEENKLLSKSSFFSNATLRIRSLRPNKQLKTIIIFVLGILLLSFILVKIVRFFSSRPKPVAVVATARVSEAKTQAQPKLKAQVPLSKPVVNEAKFPKASSGGISLVISAKEDCLVLVKVDGRVVLHRVLKKGRSDSWKAKDRIDLDLGNAAAVELIVNGQRFTNLGRRGQQIKNIVITEKVGLKIP